MTRVGEVAGTAPSGDGTDVEDPPRPHPDDPTDDRPAPRRLTRADTAVAVGLPGFVLLAHTLFYGPWIEDDAGITFAYARSITEGLGPVLQPGAAPVEGWSNPLWLGVMIVGRALGLFDHGTWFGLTDQVAFPKSVALLCGLAMFAAFLGVARRAAENPVLTTVLAGTATALVPSFVIWSTSGLENALFALVVVVLAAILARSAIGGTLLDTRTAVVCGALAAAAALTRPDGTIYVLAHPLVVALLCRADVRRAAVAAAHGVAAFALPVGLYGVWRLVTFGDWLPNTARAKVQGLPSAADLNRPGDLLAYAGWLAVVGGVVLVVVASRRHGPTRRALVGLGIPLVLALTAYAVLAPDWMGQYRFATPVWPLGALAIAVALDRVWSGSSRRRLIAVLAAVAVVGSVAGFAEQAVAFRTDTTAPMCFVAQAVGERADAYAGILGIRSGALLAVDGGGTALTSRLRFVDLSGLTDRRIAQAWQDDDMTAIRDYVFDDVRPTFIKSERAFGGGVRSGITSDPRLARDYILLFSLAPESGTWVRRDAVADPARIAVARAWATPAYRAVENSYLQPGAQTQWRCGPGLTPASRFPYPLPTG